MPMIRVMPPLLAGDVVRLRQWGEGDVAGLVAAFGDPVMRRYSWRDEPMTEVDAREHLAGMEAALLQGEAFHMAVVEAGRPAPLLGGVSVHEIRLDRGTAAVGYWLGPQGRGRGAATQAVRLMAGWAFDELGLARLELTCGPDNTASQRVAERCGFVREGLLRSHMPFRGSRRDSLIYGLLRGELH
ncbi:GNAT family protein [Dactylosporangium sp. NPDC005555]|uniref:GNAT family N-acetyltransferase n=1 Tax=Dactylosporangium sp. NPDC005555 TaxID=3154889 RepID=UPI0033AD0BC6